jgi:GNAT superfamily N-acetyltransferase
VWNALQSGDTFKLVDPDGLLTEADYDLGVLMREDPVDRSTAIRSSAPVGSPPSQASTLRRSGSGVSSNACRRDCCAPRSVCNPSADRCSPLCARPAVDTVTHMTLVERAGINDIAALVALETKLFLEDAGQHDQYTDVTWPTREGHRDFERLLADPNALVLAARHGGEVVGYLDAYISESSPSRKPVRYAVLRSMYVNSDLRRQGVGHLLVERFTTWARSGGCVEAYVDSYVANGAAQNFYEQLGFTSRSLSRVLPL